MDLTLPLSALIAGSIDGQTAVMAAIERMTPDEYAAPSRLPGWSRAHVVAHLIGNTLAQTRQVQSAQRGERVDVYTGGQLARDTEIERRAMLQPVELAALLSDAHDAWADAAAQVDDRLAATPVAYRDGIVSDVIVGRWIESLVHGVDLAVPTVRSGEWTPEFSALLLGYVAERLPTGQQVRIEATDTSYDQTFGMTDGETFSTADDGTARAANYTTIGSAQGATFGSVRRGGSGVHLRGQIADIAAFLADRRGMHGIESLGESLGELRPYPRGSVRR